MPSVTISSIIERAKIKTDNVDSEFMNDAEALLILNDLRMSLYTQLYTKCDPALFLEEVEVSLTDGVGTIPSDVFQIKKVEGKTSGVYYNLEPRSLSEVSDLDSNNAVFNIDAPTNTYYYIVKDSIKVKPVGSVDTLRLLYNPIPEAITSVDDVITTVFHEDRWLVAMLCVNISIKEETDSTPWYIEKNDVFLEIVQSYKRDNAYPKKIIDVNNRYPGRGSSRRRGRYGR